MSSLGGRETRAGATMHGWGASSKAADGGGQQRACCIVYDATGPWAACNKAQLTYWHCLDDEQWQHAE